MPRKIIFLLFIIFLTGCLLRFYRLGNVPSGFHRDEAFLGYNAFSLLKTGRDMSGKLLPLHFESFIYSPGGYSYFSIPAIFIFGLSEFSVRFASAFFGSLTILLTFFLTHKLFSKSTYLISIFSALFIAITPWHINLSRTATENVIVVFFISLGVYLFAKWTTYKSLKYLLLSFISFAITLTLYQAPRAFLPLFIPVLTWSMINIRLKKNILPVILCYLFFIILPVITILLSPTLATRMKTVGIWSTEETKLTVNEQIREDGVMGINPKISRAIHNKLLGYTEVFLTNYFQHFSFNFLFTDKGMPDRYRVPDSGLLYIFMLPLIVLGILHMYKKYPQQGILLFSWVLLAVVGSALTFDDIPNLQRTLIVFPALAIISAAGIEKITTFQKKYLVNLVLLVFICVSAFEIYRYLHHYYVQQLVHRPWYRQEGYRTLISDIEKIKNNYSHVVITNRETAPAIFFLFYTKYDPHTFQLETKNSKLRDFDRVDFASYTFSQEECPLKEITYTDPLTQENTIKCYGEEKTLFVNSGLCELPRMCANTINVIKRNDNTAVFQILEPSAAFATMSGKVIDNKSK